MFCNGMSRNHHTNMEIIKKIIETNEEDGAISRSLNAKLSCTIHN